MKSQTRPPIPPPIRPLGLYIHWPFCVAKCPYCDFNSHVETDIDAGAWRDAYCLEMDFQIARLQEQCGYAPGAPRLNSIFIGGGTPSLMSPALIDAILQHAAKKFQFAQNIEITLEANPSSVEVGKLKTFASLGINRLSLGMQSLDDAGLAFLGRTHSASQALHALEQARTHFSRLSADLIYGLPDQTAQNWTDQLAQIAAFDLSHISCYQLTIEPGTIFHTRMRAGEMLTAPDDHIADLYLLTEDRLSAQNLKAYEVSNYAREGQACAHNINYWRMGNWLGIGPGAHARFSVFSSRYFMINRRAPQGWLEAVQKRGDGCDRSGYDDIAACRDEYWLMGMRLTAGVPYPPIDAQFDIDHSWRDRFIAENWLKQGPQTLSPTLQGRLRLDTIISKLLG